MGPSADAIEHAKNLPIIGNQINNVLLDFNNCIKEIEVNQYTLDSLFLFFCFGMANVLNVESNFNLKYKVEMD